MSRKFTGRPWSGAAQIIVTLTLTAAVSGCFELNTHILVHQDGSATITERMTISEPLLDMDSQDGPAGNIASLLTKEAALARMKEMGKGIRLVSHDIRPAAKGAKESVAVLKIADISEFRYVSPYLAVLNYPKHNVLVCKMSPMYETTWYGRRAGQMAVTFTPATRERQRGTPGEPPPPPSPVSLQALRDLHPLFRDLMEDFKVKITFESYAPLRFRQYYRYRGRRSITYRYDLIDFSADDLDNYGSEFLGNEEIVLELLRAKLGGPNVLEHTKGHADNLTLPVLHPGGTPEIYFNPSRTLFDRHMKGKTLKFDKRNGGPRPAKFEEIGFKGKK